MAALNKEEMDKVIFEIGDLIHVRNKSKYPIIFGLGFGSVKLSPQEIIDAYEFKMEFEKPFPAMSKFILENFKEVNKKWH
jgi:hypothetical protein